MLSKLALYTDLTIACSKSPRLELVVLALPCTLRRPEEVRTASKVLSDSHMKQYFGLRALKARGQASVQRARTSARK